MALRKASGKLHSCTDPASLAGSGRGWRSGKTSQSLADFDGVFSSARNDEIDPREKLCDPISDLMEGMAEAGEVLHG